MIPLPPPSTGLSSSLGDYRNPQRKLGVSFYELQLGSLVVSRTSASFIKTGRSNKQSRPKEGTRLGEAYDLLLAGKSIDPRLYSTQPHNLRKQLEEYSLEIISEPNYDIPSPTRPYVFYRCTGVWNGMHLLSLEDVRKALGE